MANRVNGVPVSEPRGISICCGQPHEQYSEVDASVRSRNFSGSNVFSNGVVTDDSSERRMMSLVPGATAIDIKSTNCV